MYKFKTFPIYFLILIAFHSNINAQEIKAKQLWSKKTKEHLNVIGTNLFLKIPKEYEPLIACIGWYNRDQSSIVISKRQKSIKETSAEINQLILNTGYVFEQDKNILFKFNSQDAVYFEAKNDTMVKQFFLIFENDFTYIIEGNCNYNKKEYNKMKKIVLSAFFEK